MNYSANVFSRSSFFCPILNKTASFCSLKEAFEIEWTSDKAKKSIKRTPKDYFLLQGRSWMSDKIVHGCIKTSCGLCSYAQLSMINS